MLKSRSCTYCHNDFPPSAVLCPHCARPALYPNVFAAEDDVEREALESRYQATRKEIIKRGAGAVLKEFEKATADSKAVIARNKSEVLRLATSTQQLYATYYQLTEGKVRLPDGDEWDVLRQLADTALFLGYKEDLRFGALSLDGVGLSNYGECSIVLRDDMISHRASVFEENSALFMERNNIKISRNPDLPKGYRATWDDRIKLCAAKLGCKIDSETNSDKYSELLIKKGASSVEDEFIEVHIWGPITVLTIEQVNVTSAAETRREAVIRAITAKLAKHNVKVN